MRFGREDLSCCCGAKNTAVPDPGASLSPLADKIIMP